MRLVLYADDVALMGETMYKLRENFDEQESSVLRKVLCKA